MELHSGGSAPGVVEQRGRDEPEETVVEVEGGIRRNRTTDGLAPSTLQQWAEAFVKDEESTMLQAQERDVFARSLGHYLRSNE